MGMHRVFKETLKHSWCESHFPTLTYTPSLPHQPIRCKLWVALPLQSSLCGWRGELFLTLKSSLCHCFIQHMDSHAKTCMHTPTLQNMCFWYTKISQGHKSVHSKDTLTQERPQCVLCSAADTEADEQWLCVSRLSHFTKWSGPSNIPSLSSIHCIHFLTFIKVPDTCSLHLSPPDFVPQNLFLFFFFIEFYFDLCMFYIDCCKPFCHLHEKVLYIAVISPFSPPSLYLLCVSCLRVALTKAGCGWGWCYITGLT